MDSTIETQGLRVLTIEPSHKGSDVNVNTNIDITFNSDVNPATFEKNIVILEDYNKIFINASSLKDYSQYAVVKGSVAYSNRVLTFTPSQPLQTNTCYIVMLNDNIADITGNRLIKKYISCFYTEQQASYPVPKFMSPKYGCIASEVPEFTWENVTAPAYIFQISKVNSFESLLLNIDIPGNQITEFITYLPQKSIFSQEGIYFIRVKAENGDWSNVHQIFIKPITDAVVAEQDFPESVDLEEFLDGLEEPLEILDYFPAPNSINNSLKTNIIYIKIKGKLDESDIHLEDTFVYGESLDEEHEEYAHQELEGTWTVVYDSYFDVTYVIFTPDSLEPEQEIEQNQENTPEEENNSEENNTENTSEEEQNNTEETNTNNNEQETNSETNETTQENNQETNQQNNETTEEGNQENNEVDNTTEPNNDTENNQE